MNHDPSGEERADKKLQIFIVIAISDRRPTAADRMSVDSYRDDAAIMQHPAAMITLKANTGGLCVSESALIAGSQTSNATVVVIRVRDDGWSRRLNPSGRGLL